MVSEKSDSCMFPIKHFVLGESNQPKMIDELFKGAKNKFFIEAGAHDGEEISNTLFLEMQRNWTGLLVEPNPNLFKQLLQKNR